MTGAPWKAGFVYFALVIGCGIAFGSVRVPLIVPRLGERYAELLEMPFMLVAIVLAARFVVRRFALAPAHGARLFAGCLALLLAVAAELALAMVLQDRTIAEFVRSRDPVSGSVYLLMLGVFALMPDWLMLINRTRGSRS